MSHKTLLAAACGILALTASAISVPVAVASSPTAHPSATRLTAAERATLSPLGALPDKIEHFGDTNLKGNYSSLVVTRNRSHIDVYLTSLNPKAETELRALAPGGTISFTRASHTRQQMLSVHQKVTRDVGALAARGIHIVRWFPGVMGDGLEHIGVEHLTPAHARIIKKMFGIRNIVVQNVPTRDMPVSTGRNNDSAPWNGGDNLTNVEGCTSGAGITYKGTNYMLTAAHCYTPGEPVYNAFPGQQGPKMGTEHSRDVSDGGDDTALLSMPVSGLIWTGIPGKPARTTVHGSGTNPVGDTVCNEGAYSGEVCATVESYLPGSGGCLEVARTLASRGIATNAI